MSCTPLRYVRNVAREEQKLREHDSKNHRKGIIMSTLEATQTLSYLSSSFVALSINSGNPIISTTASAYTANTKTEAFVYYRNHTKLHEFSFIKATARRKLKQVTLSMNK